MLFTVLMLGSCGQKPEESTTTPQHQLLLLHQLVLPLEIQLSSSKKPESARNKTAVLAATQKINSAYL
ncbi:hypothetical protein [Nostoc sp.]|uniref:hypothetical protein n=1 Tax=Nostoc sp. TaxID=1180 RepID=UPI002FF7DA65